MFGWCRRLPALCFVPAIGLLAPINFVPHAMAAGPAGSMDAFYAKLAAAEAAEGAGDLVEAGRLYDEAYDAMPEQERGSETGSDVVRVRARVGREAFFANPEDPAPLDASSALLERHMLDVEQHDPGRDTAELAKLQASTDTLLARVRTDTEGKTDDAGETSEAGQETETDPVEEDPRPQLQPETQPPPPRDRGPADGPDKQRRALGLGLTIGGGVFVLGGIAAFVIGDNLISTGEANYEANLPDHPECQAPDTDCALKQFRETEIRRGRVAYGVGGAALGIGVGVAIAGVVILVKNRRNRNVAVSPMQLRRGGGLSLAGSF